MRFIKFLKSVSYYFLIGIALSGCSFTSDKYEIIPRHSYQADIAHHSVHEYTNRIASNLMISMQAIKPGGRIAIGTFLPADSLEAMPDNHPLNDLGLQIQEGLTTAMTQMGFAVIEFKTLNAVTLNPNSDAMLSRDASLLPKSHRVDYFLTGTLVEQQDAFIVNAKLIDIMDNHVLAAATNAIPVNIFWGDEKVRLRSGTLYRTEY